MAPADTREVKVMPRRRTLAVVVLLAVLLAGGAMIAHFSGILNPFYHRLDWHGLMRSCRAGIERRHRDSPAGRARRAQRDGHARDGYGRDGGDGNACWPKSGRRPPSLVASWICDCHYNATNDNNSLVFASAKSCETSCECRSVPWASLSRTSVGWLASRRGLAVG